MSKWVGVYFRFFFLPSADDQLHYLESVLLSIVPLVKMLAVRKKNLHYIDSFFFCYYVKRHIKRCP